MSILLNKSIIAVGQILINAGIAFQVFGAARMGVPDASDAVHHVLISTLVKRRGG